MYRAPWVRHHHLSRIHHHGEGTVGTVLRGDGGAEGFGAHGNAQRHLTVCVGLAGVIVLILFVRVVGLFFFSFFWGFNRKRTLLVGEGVISW